MTHVERPDWDIRNGILYFADRSCLEILTQNDHRPVYVYSGAEIKQRVAHLKATIDERIDIHYAVKANPNQAVVNLIAKTVDGLDVASAMELEVALQSGCPVNEISMAGPGKSAQDLESAIEAGITLNVESETELSRISKLCEQRNTKAKVALRVNPDFELKASGMKMAGGAKQFGIDAEQIGDVAKQLDANLHDFQGFHIFWGSQNLSADSICEAQIRSYELALELTRLVPHAPRFINLGGGFGVPYFPGEKPLDLDPVANNLHKLADRCEQDLPNTKLVLELGRYIVAEAGYYLCEVTDVKRSRGELFAITNGGLHHHLAASGNFGQILRKNYPVFIANRMHEQAVEPVSVVGPLCTPLDLLADKMALPKVQIGDVIMVAQSGAYGFTASPHLFLSHPTPVEQLV